MDKSSKYNFIDLKIEKYSEKAEQVEELERWLISLGLEYVSSRIQYYITNISLLNNYFERNQIKEFNKQVKFLESFVSFLEINELLNVHKYLSEYDKNILVNRLNQVLMGPLLPTDEDCATNLGRNIVFELNIAARLKASGYNPLMTINEEDVSIIVGNNKLFLECKRPQSIRSLERNINKAKDQLTERFKNSDIPPRGIIAISISKILNDGDKILKVKNEQVLNNTMNNITSRFVTENRILWDKFIDWRIIGVLLHMLIPVVIEDINLMTVAEFICFNNTIPTKLLLVKSSDFLLLEELAKNIKKQ